MPNFVYSGDNFAFSRFSLKKSYEYLDQYKLTFLTSPHLSPDALQPNSQTPFLNLWRLKKAI
jgi:hypothetical protein